MMPSFSQDRGQIVKLLNMRPKRINIYESYFHKPKHLIRFRKIEKNILAAQTKKVQIKRIKKPGILDGLIKRESTQTEKNTTKAYRPRKKRPDRKKNADITKKQPVVKKTSITPRTPKS